MRFERPSSSSFSSSYTRYSNLSVIESDLFSLKTYVLAWDKQGLSGIYNAINSLSDYSNLRTKLEILDFMES